MGNNNLPIDLLHWGIAFLPIVALLVLMINLRWGAAKAGPVGWLIALVSSFFLYKASWQLLTIETIKGIWNSLIIIYVIWPAILIYEVTQEAKAFDPFRRAIERITPNRLLQVLLFGWVFASFLQGITGFGVPVAVAAPLLVGIGVRPLYGVIIPLAAHAWANTFGTLAVAWEALKLVTNMEGAFSSETALYASVFLWLLNILAALTVCWIYGRKEGIKEGFPAVIVISFIQGGGQLILSQWNDTLNCFASTIVAFFMAILLGRTSLYNKPSKITSTIFVNKNQSFVPRLENTNLSGNQAFFPYYVLLILTFGINLIIPLKNFFGSLKIGFSVPATSTGFGYYNSAIETYAAFSPLTHAGTFLSISALAGYFYFKNKGCIESGGWKRIILNTNNKTLPSAIAVITLVTMSKLMGGSGQTEVLANGVAYATGSFYPILSPLIGMLGSFMTSSNMASNILFGDFQITTADILSLNKSVILAAQTAGGATGNIIAPGNVLLGTTTAGILGQEGEVLKYTLVIAITVAAIIGLAVFLLA